MSDTTVIDKRLSPETIISAALLTPGVNGNLKLSQIAKLIHRVKSKGVDISTMTCYLTGGAAHCDDLDRHVGKLHSFKLARDLSPVTLNEDGIQDCEKILSEAELEEDATELGKLRSKLAESLKELGFSSNRAK